MLSWSKRISPATTLFATATLLAGCVTGTEVSYSKYQYDRYGRTERTYERNSEDRKSAQSRSVGLPWIIQETMLPGDCVTK